MGFPVRTAFSAVSGVCCPTAPLPAPRGLSAAIWAETLERSALGPSARPPTRRATREAVQESCPCPAPAGGAARRERAALAPQAWGMHPARCWPGPCCGTATPVAEGAWRQGARPPGPLICVARCVTASRGRVQVLDQLWVLLGCRSRPPSSGVSSAHVGHALGPMWSPGPRACVVVRLPLSCQGLRAPAVCLSVCRLPPHPWSCPPGELAGRPGACCSPAAISLVRCWGEVEPGVRSVKQEDRPRCCL